MNKDKLRIGIIGLGWFGSPLAKALLHDGHVISGTTRATDKETTHQQLGINTSILAYPQIPHQELLNQDILILNIPPFAEELEWFKKWQWSKNLWVIFISSTSVYPVADGQSAEILKQQEEWIQSQFNNWTIIRFGGLLGSDRHPGKYLSGKKNLQGKNWPVNLIHQEDCIGVTKAIIDQNIRSKIIHAVAEEHPTRQEFYTSYCLKNNLPVPEFNPQDISTGKVISNEEMRHFYKPLKSLLS